MSDPNISLQHSLSNFQVLFNTIVSSNRSTSNNSPKPGNLAFGLPVETAVPRNYVNNSPFVDESFYNLFTDPRFKKVPVRVIYYQGPDQKEPSVIGQSTSRSPSVVDNNLHLSSEIANQGCIDAFSKPRASVAIIKPQLATNSSWATNQKDSLPISDKEARASYSSSDKRKGARARYEASNKGKEARARYRASDQAKKVRARYMASDNYKKARAKYLASNKCKMVRAKYEASDKGKKARAKYDASDKRKQVRARYQSTDKYKKVKDKYESSDKRKLGRVISNARSNAYRAALKKGFSEEVARKKGELAANVKKAELLSAFPSATQSPD